MNIISTSDFFLAAAGAVENAHPFDGNIKSLWQVIQSGGMIMYPLGAASVIGLALVLTYFFSMRRGVVASARYMQAADALIRKKDYLGLLALSTRHDDAVAGVVERALDFMTRTPGVPMSAVRDVAQTEGVRLAGLWNQRVSYLSDIAALSPMLGLLGTVAGMVKSFSAVASESTATRPMMLAGGVAEALIATAAGLAIGITLMASYAYFRGRVQQMVSDLEAASTILMAQICSGSREN